jgi:hypothetical protein
VALFEQTRYLLNLFSVEFGKKWHTLKGFDGVAANEAGPEILVR